MGISMPLKRLEPYKKRKTVVQVAKPKISKSITSEVREDEEKVNVRELQDSIKELTESIKELSSLIRELIDVIKSKS